MTSFEHGADISLSEVTGIAQHGFWLLADDREYFVPFTDYPIFRSATVAQIYRVQRLSPDQFYWPELDVDIELAALDQPGAYPLIYKE